MKTILTVFILALATGLHAQKVKEAEVPAPVKAAFTKLYPAVKDVDWEKEETYYEAEFELNAIETSVLIDTQGNLKETETEIAVSALPKNITDYIATNFAGYKIKEAAKISDASGTVTYEAEVSKGSDKYDLIFDSNGAFLKKDVEKED